MKKRKLISLLAIVLSLTLVFQFLPENIAFATTSSNTETSSQEIVDSSDDILYEIESRREESVKHFKLRDGSVVAAIYPDVVHKLNEEGELVDIDNTLGENGDVFENTDGLFDISFAKKPKSNKMVEIEYGEYSISFGIENIKDTNANVKNVAKTKKSTLHKTTSQARYDDAFTGIDLVYDLSGSKLKESIVIKEYTGINTFTFTYRFGGLTPVLNSDGSVTLFDENEQVFEIQAPYMFDSDRAQSDAIEVSLVQHGSKYEYTITADEEWLAAEDRVYPVTIDPTVATKQETPNIYDTYVSSNNAATEGYREKRNKLLVGYSNGGDRPNNYGPYRTYIWFDMPSIPSGSRVSNATLFLFCHDEEWQNYEDIGIDENIRIDLYELIPGQQQVDTICWNNSEALVDFQKGAIDYQRLRTGALVEGENDRYSWNITTLIDQYYTVKNSGNAPTIYNPGMMLKFADETTTTNDFYAGFHSGNSSSTGMLPCIAISYIDAKGIDGLYDYFTSTVENGGIGYVNSFNGNLSYANTILAESGSRMPTTVSVHYNSAEYKTVPAAMGAGWRLNINQYIEHKPVTDDNPFEYYAYTDADGSVHYFSEYEGKFVEETGSGMYLTDDGTYITLQYEGQSGKVVFKYASEVAYISYVEDSSGNRLTYTYSESNPAQVTSITDGAGRVTQITYTNSLVTGVTDPAGRTTTFVYSGTQLEGIVYPDGKTINFTYTDISLTEKILTQISSFTGAKVKYTYDEFNRVTKIEEFDRDGYNINTYQIFYEHKNITRIVDKFAEELLYQFDFYGRTTSVVDEDGNAIYSTHSGMSDDNYYVRNKLLVQSDVQTNIANRIKNGGFEAGLSYWTDMTGTSLQNSSEHYLGSYSMEMDGVSIQQVAVEKGKTYTLSAYIKTAENSTAYIFMGSAMSEPAQNSDTWERYDVTFTATVTGTVDIGVDALGTAYFDCFQLEEDDAPNRLNLIENGTFDEGTNAWTISSINGAVETENVSSAQFIQPAYELCKQNFNFYSEVPANWYGYKGTYEQSNVAISNGAFVGFEGHALRLTGRTDSSFTPAYDLYPLLRENGAGAYYVQFMFYAENLAEFSTAKLILSKKHINEYTEEITYETVTVSDSFGFAPGSWTRVTAELIFTDKDIADADGAIYLGISELTAGANQNLYIDEFIIARAPHNKIANNSFADNAALFTGKNASLTVTDSGLQVQTQNAQNSAVKYDITRILKRYGATDYKLSLGIYLNSVGSANAYIIDEAGNKLNICSTSLVGQIVSFEQKFFVPEAYLANSENFWLCIGSDTSCTFTVYSGIQLEKYVSGNGVLKLVGDNTQDVCAYQTVNLNVPDSKSLVLTGWAKADAVPDNEEYNSGKWFGMYVKINYSDSSDRIIPVEFNTAVRIDGNLTTAPWQCVSTAVPLKSEGTLAKTVSSVTVYLCYNKNLNTAYFDNVQLFYDEFGESYLYDKKGNVISAVDSANQETNFNSSGTDISKVSNPDGTGFEYYYTNKNQLRSYTSAQGVGGIFYYDTYGNVTGATTYADNYTRSLQENEVYRIHSYDGKFITVWGGSPVELRAIDGTAGSIDNIFHLEKAENGYYRIKNSYQQLYLEKASDGTGVTAQPSNSNKGQQWEFIYQGNGKYKIVNRIDNENKESKDKYYLTFNYSSGEVFTALDNGSNATTWYFNHVDVDYNADACVYYESNPMPQANKTYAIFNVLNGKYFDTDINLFFGIARERETGRSCQNILLQPVGNGYYRLIPNGPYCFGDYCIYADDGGGIALGYDLPLDDTSTWFSIGSANIHQILTYSGEYVKCNEYGYLYYSSSTEDSVCWAFEEISPQMNSSAEYSSEYNYNYLTKETDVNGNSVTYAYDFAKGIMTSSTDSLGTTTNYTYNNKDQLTSVTTAGQSVSYTYDDNYQLSTITAGATSYSFFYDALGRTREVRAGYYTLVENIYSAESGLLTESIYGNGDSRRYVYDSNGRVKKLIIDNVARYEYNYNSDGNIHSFKDIVANVTYKYTYDLLDRPVRVKSSSGFEMKVTYDEFNRASDVEFSYGAASLATTWRYGQANMLDRTQQNGVIYGVKYNGVEKLTYAYDQLMRKASTTINTTAPFTTSYKYRTIGVYNDATTQVEKITYSNGKALSYTYDGNGNILAIRDENNALIASYEYDSLGQLIRENDAVANVTKVYTYYNGNMYYIDTYAYTTGTLGERLDRISYDYWSSDWNDLLTYYDGLMLSPDSIGNPLNWRDGMQFTWSEGRRLATFAQGTTNASYTYNQDGIRTSKTVNGVRTDYYLNGTTIVMQKTGDNCIWFTYDENGLVTGFKYNNQNYYYYKNLQGDIIGIVDESGAIVAQYAYDAWGTPTLIADSSGNDVSTNANHLANINPFRYRGYYYDNESGFYYLNSRYYDPIVCRFLNADGVSLFSYEMQTVQQYNMFSYCWNNPVNMCDFTGEWPIFVTIIVAVICASILTAEITRVINYVNNKENQKNITGLIDDQKSIDYMKMGFAGAAWSGCGWVAAYNAMYLLGRPQNAADVIGFFDGSVNNFVHGAFGVAPYAITLYFVSMGCTGKINSVMFCMPSDTEEVARKASVCILLYAHSQGAHYVALKWDGEKYNIYNDLNKTSKTIKEHLEKVGGTFVNIWCID